MYMYQRVTIENRKLEKNRHQKKINVFLPSRKNTYFVSCRKLHKRKLKA